ncbi:DUF4349 domain-containing protein [Belliella marina]|uniref:DUF4349 domain-containing protein n=1 Tax=Belliella marina TaxID=1644146 RepID=A0ABW4VI55_9BACT
MTLIRNVVFATHFSILMIVLFSCENYKSDGFSYSIGDSGEYEEMLDIPITEQAPPRINGQEEQVDEMGLKKFIKTGGVEFESKNVVDDFVRIRQILPKYKAYIESENQVNNRYQITYTLIIKVPYLVYDSVFHQLSNIGKRVDHKYSNIEDVTSRYSDLEAKIETKKLLEKRYRELLAKAISIKDMLEIEKSLNDLRAEIDLYESRFKVLKQQIKYSTLHVRFYENLESNSLQNEKGFFVKIGNAVKEGFILLQSFIVFMFKLWPFILILVVGIFVWLRIRKV